MGIILKRDVALIFVFVFLDQITTYFGIFHYNLEEANPIGRFIFQTFGKHGIFLTFLHEFLGTLALFCLIRYLRIKIFKRKLQTEYFALIIPAAASINNLIILL